MLRKIKGFMFRAAVRTMTAEAVLVQRLRDDEAGQSTWVSELMVLGIVLLIAAAVFAFWKAGGLAWINNQLNSITTY